MRVTPGAQPAPESAPQEQGPSPQEALQMIEGGFSALAQIIQGAEGQLSPEDIQLFQSAAEATQVMIQSLTSAPQEQGRENPSQPMPQNASARG